MRSIQKIALLLAVALMLVSCGGGTPTSPSPANPNPGSPNWTVLVSGLKVTPTPVAPNAEYSASVTVREMQAGLSYKVEWILRNPAGNDTALSTISNTTQATGNASQSNMSRFAPNQRGTYKLIWRQTETLGGQSNTIESTADLIVQ